MHTRMLLHLGQRYTITSWIGARCPHSLTSLEVFVLPYDLSLAKHHLVVALDHIQRVPHTSQLGNDLFGYPILDRDGPVEEFGRARVGRVHRANQKSLGVQCSLRVVFPMQQITTSHTLSTTIIFDQANISMSVREQYSPKDLDMTLGLHQAAHDAIGADQLLALGDHRRWIIDQQLSQTVSAIVAVGRKLTDDGVVWPLSTFQAVWMTFLEHKSATSTL